MVILIRSQFRYSGFIVTLVVCGLLNWRLVAAVACPFCTPPQQSLSEELSFASAAVIATLAKPTSSEGLDDPSAEEGSATTSAQFRVKEVLSGEHAKVGDLIEAVYFGTDPPDKEFLITGILGNQLDWTIPLPLSPGSVEYLKQLPALPPAGKERLTFFLNYLEDSDPFLSQDAYDEFARAPYADLIALKDVLDHEELVRWINDPGVGPTQRRLYLTMLGVCGGEADIAMLEELLNYDYESMRPGIAALIGVMGVGGSSLGVSLVDELAHADVRAKQQCLDALIAAYLKLKGPDGLALIEERFLKNPHTEYTQLYSTIMALRFHGEESSEIPTSRLVQSLRLLLDNSGIADQVIPDLTRWEDWEVMDRLVAMFKSSEKDGWIRQPVVSYLLVAADQVGNVGEKANAAIAELEAIDPEGVKRARSYLSFGLMARGTSKAASGETSATTDIEQSTAPSGENSEADKLGDKVAAESISPAAKDLDSEAGAKPLAPSRPIILMVPLALMVIMMGLFHIMLRSGSSGS